VGHKLQYISNKYVNLHNSFPNDPFHIIQRDPVSRVTFFFVRISSLQESGHRKTNDRRGLPEQKSAVFLVQTLPDRSDSVV